MSTPRQTLAEQIRADNPEFVVVDYPFEPANVNAGKPVVAVWRPSIEPVTTKAGIQLRHDLVIQIYGAKLDAGPGRELELDDALDQVLLSVQRSGLIEWARAERSTFRNDTLHGWVITGYGASPNVYRNTVSKELSNGV